MNIIRVKLKERSYDIFIGAGIISGLGIRIKKILKQDAALVITNSRISKLFIKDIKRSLNKAGLPVAVTIIPDSEKAKSFYYLNQLLNNVALLAKEKKPFVIAFGGGVVGDVSGFVASIYRRGIPYVQVPTTLLAQIDSSIGGKTAIDLSLGKNLAGAFYQPSLVLSEVNFLKTLPEREIRSGMAEMIKYALIKDAKFFDYLESHWREIIKLKPALVISAISNCARIKAEIVSKDEFEKKGIRTILNFGHTIGHAIETASNYKYNHGEAIALGMIVASRISLSMGLISSNIFDRIFLMIGNCGLPTEIKSLDPDKLLDALSYDKKFIGRKNRFVLLRGIGKAVVRESISGALIYQALKETGL